MNMVNQDETASLAMDNMARDIRSWAKWLVFWGVLDLALSKLGSGFGLILIAVGIASLKSRVAAMFVVMAVIFAWAAVANLLSLAVGEGGKLTWAILEILCAYRALRHFLDYRSPDRDRTLVGVQGEGVGLGRAPQLFPLGSAGLGLFSIVAIISAFLLAMAFPVTGNGEIAPTGPVNLAFDLPFQTGVLGLALGLASLLSGYRYKPLAAFGTLIGALFVIALVVLVLGGS